MTRICNFPISNSKRCTQPIIGDKPNCGRHHCEISADQLGQSPTIYQKGHQLHVWAGEPSDFYCLIHSDPAYQVLYQLAGEVLPCCLNKAIEYKDEDGQLHRDDGPALIMPDGMRVWYYHGERHRDDGPAAIGPDGEQLWYQHNKRHREDGPARTWPNGMRWWYWRGKRVTRRKHAELVRLFAKFGHQSAPQ